MERSIDDNCGSIGAISASSLVGRGEIVWLQARVAVAGFTTRDRLELGRWSVGERRAVVWDAEPDFAMLYEADTPWASWAVARQDGVLVLWDCVTFADIGRFGCMVDALAALSGEDREGVDASPNVVSFAAARLRRGGAAGGVQPS